MQVLLGGALLTGLFFMYRFLAAIFLALLLPITSATATERVRIGYGRLLNNDVIGDTQDRWRTGSYASSRIWGPEWTGVLPSKFGELIELRLGAEIISPEDITRFNRDDRRYASSISVGVHTHYLAKKTEVAIGADLVFVGPQTGLSGFQTSLHDAIGVEPPSRSVLANQIDNSIEPTLVVELGRSFDVKENAHVRPFFEARAGVETLMRVGVDLTFGAFGRGELLVRDPVTGQRYRSISNGWTGFSTVIGADLTYVDSSTYLPDNRGPAASDLRERVRVGLQWQREESKGTFLGVTWLGEEFEGQSGGQLVGSARLNFKF
jgi:hypothetical protein